MPTIGTISQIDYSREVGKTTFHVDSAITGTQWTAIVDAVDGLSGGTITQTVTSDVTNLSNALPESNSVQREEKLLVSYQDNVTFNKYVVTIPCLTKANVTFVTNSDEIVIGGGGSAATQAFETAWGSVIKSPAGNATTILGMRYVGRNS
jgi:hypothetical protein